MTTFDTPHWLLSPPHDSYSDYLLRKGGSAVEKARSTHPEEIVAELERSGLRGRGGAGFPTGTKWRTTMAHPCPTRFVVCNAAEGEPGTFKDRYLLRRDPYSMLEGLLIAAHVVGASAAYVAMKASFTKELSRVRSALVEALDRSLRSVMLPTEALYAGDLEDAIRRATRAERRGPALPAGGDVVAAREILARAKL